MAWRLCCVKSRRKKGSDSKRRINATANYDDELPPPSLECNSSGENENRVVTLVEIDKQDEASLGLILVGGADKDGRPRIASLRPGGVASRSDALQVGDVITAVNGKSTARMRHEEIVALLKNADDRLQLEVNYDLPSRPDTNFVLVRTTEVALLRDNGSLGLTIRGGQSSDPCRSRPLTITNVRPGGPADRDGTIKVGDRVVGISGVSVGDVPLAEAQRLMREAGDRISLKIDYDVSLVEAVKNAQGPLLVQVERPCGTSLGVALGKVPLPPPAEGHVTVIESLKPASIAERCGALHVGDHVLAVGDTRVDGHLTCQDVTQFLRNYPSDVVQLQILPVAAQKRVESRRVLPPLSPRLAGLPPVSPFHSNYNTLSSKSRNSRKVWRPLQRENSVLSRHDTASLSSGSSQSWPTHSISLSPSHGVSNSNSNSPGMSHVESVWVTLPADSLCSSNYGLNFAPTELGNNRAIIDEIESGSPADRCGCLQPGDRVLAINQKSVTALSGEEVSTLLADTRPPVTLAVEFHVADSVVPSSGVFTVKVPKRGANLGLTLACPKARSEGLIIADVQQGSIAHRTGSIQAGDRLLAINHHRLEGRHVEEAFQLFQASEEIVVLKIQKDESFSDDTVSQVVYTVELIRHGGPLGITVSGTEEPFDPIIISGLTEGGLAERTGALHVGDRLLAINSKSLRGKPLSEAIDLLQSSADVVTLKIAKPAPPKINHMNAGELEREDYFGKFPALPSIDSAVESWDSGGAENLPLPSVTEITTYKAESATVKRRHKVLMPVERRDTNSRDWDVLSHSSPSVDSGQSEEKTEWRKSLDDLDHDTIRPLPRPNHSNESGNTRSTSSHSLDHHTDSEPCPRLSDLALIQRCNTLPHKRRLPNANDQGKSTAEVGNFVGSYAMPYMAISPVANNSALEVHHVTLDKDGVYEDFGFSVSDGLYERGVYVNRIRKGGPADGSGVLKSFDRILQVNETRTHDFDCCLTVPLIAAAGDTITLLVARNPFATPTELKDNHNSMPWMEEEESENVSPCPPFLGLRTITTTL